MKPIVVVGAGPVGLFLATLLASRGMPVRVLERRSQRSAAAGFRSIGLHPPALEALDVVGLAQPLVACGVLIRRAHVIYRGSRLGSLALDRCPPPFPFVLSIPQGTTEDLLARRLSELPSALIEWGKEVVDVETRPVGVTVGLQDGNEIEATFVVACDGHASRLRGLLGASERRYRARHHYLMADLPDSSDLGTDAAIYLGDEGVVESFPLPGERRRWVMRVEPRAGEGDYARLREAVARRAGEDLPSFPAIRTNHFIAQNRLFHPLAGERWALAGDSAHVVSPIGGQGMNLGLLGAAALLQAGLGTAGWDAEGYGRQQERRARRAARRARLNMWLGSGEVPAPLLQALLSSLLSRQLAPRAARYFTMRGL